MRSTQSSSGPIEAVTPSRRQYLEIKARYPGVILLYQIGDFYETFDEDARLIASELQITLTTKTFGKGIRVPLAGVPVHSVGTYLLKLLAKGYRVAICDQVSEPGHGLVERKVRRVVTPGTLSEPNLLPARENLYLAAICSAPDGLGLAYVDVSSGQFYVTQWQGAQAAVALEQELGRIKPTECLLEEQVEDWRRGLKPRQNELEAPLARALSAAGHLTALPAQHFAEAAARDLLCQHYRVRSLEAFGCAGLPLAIGAAAAILKYIEQNDTALLSGLAGPQTYTTQTFMHIDSYSRRNLELVQQVRSPDSVGGHHSTHWTLLGVLDCTRTAMGGRLMRRWVSQPLLDRGAITQRQDAIADCLALPAEREQLRRILADFGDLERLTSRVRQEKAVLNEVLGLCTTLELLPRICDLLQRGGRALQCLGKQISPCSDIADLIRRAIAERGEEYIIKCGFSSDLDTLISANRRARQWIASLEQHERERSGIKSLKIGHNEVFGYYIEVTKPNLSRVPADYIRKQTLANAERFITADLKECEVRILSAQEQIDLLERQLFLAVLREIGASAGPLLGTAVAIAELDVYLSLAELASRRGYTRPELTDTTELTITGGRHPVVEVALSQQQGEGFIPNDIALGGSHPQMILLTGPNMAGKSTYLRQVALIVLLAQIGSFVPASYARIGIVDRIFTRVGAQDDIAAGTSTFMIEMVETATILRHATPRSLVILDEVGRGTSTCDGLAIARAVVEHLHTVIRARTIFATHYHELTRLAGYLSRLVNYNTLVAEENEEVVFLHQVCPGPTERSYGVHVARLAGMLPAVADRAEELLTELEAATVQQPAPVPAPETRQAAPPPIFQNLPPVSIESGMLAANGKQEPEAARVARTLHERTNDYAGDSAISASMLSVPLLQHLPDGLSPALKELATANLNEVTPLEGLVKLFALQQRVRLALSDLSPATLPGKTKAKDAPTPDSEK